MCRYNFENNLIILCLRVAIKKVQLHGHEHEKENIKYAVNLKFEFIVAFYGHFVHENMLYIVMEYCPVSLFFYFNIFQHFFHLAIFQAPNLRTFLNPQMALAMREFVVLWCKQLMTTLEFLNQQDIIHNDLKPE